MRRFWVGRRITRSRDRPSNVRGTWNEGWQPGPEPTTTSVGRGSAQELWRPPTSRTVSGRPARTCARRRPFPLRRSWARTRGECRRPHVRRDQRRHPLGEGTIADAELERANLLAAKDDRHRGPRRPKTDCDLADDSLVFAVPHPSGLDTARPENLEHRTNDVSGVTAAVEHPLDRLESASIVDRAVAQAAAISQSPSSNAPI